VDRRLTPSNGQVAHVSLLGKVDAESFVEGDWMQVVGHCTPILGSVDGPRERELLCGQEFCVLDVQTGYAFGFSKNGYCGYVRQDALGPLQEATHVVSVRQTYVKGSPSLKKWEDHWPLSFGSRLLKTGAENGWACVLMPNSSGGSKHFYVPEMHLQPIEDAADDPVCVAELFNGTPYLWGGDSAFGIDCSGLVQAALQACHIACPGDSDLQEAALGHSLAENEPVLRGDLYFWKGHVAMALNATELIHVNAFHMAITVEPIDATIRRIAEQGEGAVTARKRL